MNFNLPRFIALIIVLSTLNLIITLEKTYAQEVTAIGGQVSAVNLNFDTIIPAFVQEKKEGTTGMLVKDTKNNKEFMVEEKNGNYVILFDKERKTNEYSYYYVLS